MRLMIEIVVALLLVCMITVTSAAAGSIGRSADGLGWGFSTSANATPIQRCAAIKRQCGGKFWASACSGRLLASG
jgi:hypothetical protein